MVIKAERVSMRTVLPNSLKTMEWFIGKTHRGHQNRSKCPPRLHCQSKKEDREITQVTFADSSRFIWQKMGQNLVEPQGNTAQCTSVRGGKQSRKREWRNCEHCGVFEPSHSVISMGDSLFVCRQPVIQSKETQGRAHYTSSKTRPSRDT